MPTVMGSSPDQVAHFLVKSSLLASSNTHSNNSNNNNSNNNTRVALTFEKLRIANAQHGKNCVSSPAAKATISTDLPKIDKHENTNV